jgi:hypothetical protein
MKACADAAVYRRPKVVVEQELNQVPVNGAKTPF